MKKFFITVVLSLSCVLSVSAQKQTEASTLNLIGKPFESTPNPYHSCLLYTSDAAGEL